MMKRWFAFTTSFLRLSTFLSETAHLELTSPIEEYLQTKPHHSDHCMQAFKHLLIIPRKLISGYSSLTADDLPILEEMQARGQMTVEQYVLDFTGASMHMPATTHQ